MRPAIFILAVTLCSFSCKKEAATGKTVEIYLLKTYQTIAGKCQVDASVAILQNSPVIENNDILAYSKESYQFTLSGPAIEKLRVFTDRTPFAVTVDRQVIYYGIFKPAISSSSCENSITMDVDWTTSGILLRLGYPWPTQGVSITDERNNPVLIATLKSQGKLK